MEISSSPELNKATIGYNFYANNYNTPRHRTKIYLLHTNICCGGNTVLKHELCVYWAVVSADDSVLAT